MGLLSYLALCPHVSPTEEIQLILLLPFCVPATQQHLGWPELLLLFTATLACFTSPAYNYFFADNRLLLLTLKILMMAFLLLNLGRMGGIFPHSIIAPVLRINDIVK